MLRQQQVKPHWMFALDNLLRQAVQDAITVLLPGRVFLKALWQSRIVSLFIFYSFTFSSLPHFSELKIHLQSSFEIDDSSPEDQSADPDTPIASLPDQQVAPADSQPSITIHEFLPSNSPDSPTDLLLNCPLSEKLKDLRLETRRYISVIVFITKLPCFVTHFIFIFLINTERLCADHELQHW